MSYNLYVKKQIDDIEERLLDVPDPIEQLNTWFSFIKEFSMETHVLFDKQYAELVSLTKLYTTTPDLVARGEIKKQISACAREIESFNVQFKRIPKIQSQLEKSIIDMD